MTTTFIKTVLTVSYALILLFVPIQKVLGSSIVYPSEVQSLENENLFSFDLKNKGEKELQGNLHVFDVYKMNGTHRINPSEKRQFQLGKWLKLENAYTSLGAGETKTMQAHLSEDIRKDISAGEYYGLIMFVEEGKEIPRDQFSGVKVKLNIPGDPQAKISLHVVDTIHNGESLYVVFVNEGSAEGGMQAQIAFEDTGEKHSVEVKKLYPGEAESFLVQPENAPLFGSIQAKVLGVNSDELGASQLEFSQYGKIFFYTKYIFWFIGAIALYFFVQWKFLNNEEYEQSVE